MFDTVIDTHAHLFDEQFKGDLRAVMNRAEELSVSDIILPNIDSRTIDSMLEVEMTFKSCHATMGLHPTHVKKNFEKELYIVEEWLAKRHFVAIGEIGTDLYWEDTYWEQQQEAFKIQCQLAAQYKLPVIIHCRETIDQTIDIISQLNLDGLNGVFHCFTGDETQAKKIVDLGFYLGVGGVLTFKKSNLRDVIPHVDRNRLVLETDSPYLAPVPNRGKRNEPVYLNSIIDHMGQALKNTREEVIDLTTRNARELFKV